MSGPEEYGVKLQVKINNKIGGYSTSSIFGDTIEKIKNEYSGRALKAAVNAGAKSAEKFKDIANETYWWYDHPFDKGNLTNSWEITDSGSLQWVVTNVASNPANSTIPDMSVYYIADLETIWNKPFVEQANDIFDKETTNIFNEELAQL